MPIYQATVMVEYQFEFDSEEFGLETDRDVEEYAYYNFDDYAYSSAVYSVDIQEVEEDE